MTAAVDLDLLAPGVRGYTVANDERQHDWHGRDGAARRAPCDLRGGFRLAHEASAGEVVQTGADILS